MTTRSPLAPPRWAQGPEIPASWGALRGMSLINPPRTESRSKGPGWGRVPWQSWAGVLALTATNLATH
jgi:hypothetical protein